MANPAIQLHDHKDIAPHCRQCSGFQPTRHTANRQHCWESGITLLFESIWEGVVQQVDKPLELAVGDEYLCTDMDVIIAYLLLTADHEPFQKKMLGGWSKYLKFQSRLSSSKANACIGHLGSPKHFGKFSGLTLYELDKIKNGWPPFYRRTFTSFEGFELESPIQSEDDIRRPGWLISLGLAPLTPTVYYVERDTTIGMFARVRQRLYDMMRGEVLLRWGEIEGVRPVISDISDMLHDDNPGHSGPHNPYYLPPLPNGCSVDNEMLDAYGMAHLKKEECTALMKIFNGSTLQLKENEEIILPYIVECLKRVKLAVWVALSYTRFNRILEVPLELEEHVIYLGPCP